MPLNPIHQCLLLQIIEVSTSQGVKVCAVVDKKAKQTEFNRDKLDGNGKSGYNWDVSKMQMIGIQFLHGTGLDLLTGWQEVTRVTLCLFHRMRN